MSESVLTVGGTGRLGRMVVERLIADGVSARVLSRSASPQHPLAASGVQMFHGDIRDPRSLPSAAFQNLAGLVISVEPGTANTGPNSPEFTMYRGVRHLLEACQQNNSTPHVVLVSQIYVTRSQHSMNAQGRLLDWRLRGEDAVRLSGLEYTIIRPSWLTHGHSAGEGVRLEQGDTGDGQVSIGDVATACLQGLFEPLASGKTFEIYNVAGRSPSWTELLRGLKSDSELMASAS